MKLTYKVNTILIDEIREKMPIKKERENESIRLKIDYETQFPTYPMLNDKIKKIIN
jgi:hypothetical protein